MKNILRNSIYQGKNLFRDIGFTFWGLMYPIILAGFFYIGFSGITNYSLETINVGIDKENHVSYILQDIDIFNVVEISKDDVNESINLGVIDGYVDKNLDLIVDKSELDQTIIKGVLDQIKQTIALNEPMENLDFSADYLEGKTQKANAIIIIFYSLVAMVSTYGVFPGIETTNKIQANLSNVGARINITPIKKSTLISSGVIVGLFINLISNIILILFIQFILKLELFTNIGYSSIFIILGNLFGISLGVFIGVSNRKSPGAKTMISIMITMFLSFLSGLMSVDMKILIDKKIPILGKINPISILTNNLYRINILGNTSNLGQGIALLVLYSLILMSASYIFIRRRQYDSI